MKWRANFIVLLFLAVTPVFGAPKGDAWDTWINQKISKGEIPLVTGRAISKEGKFQLVGPLVGTLERNDFYSHLLFSGGLRYFFTENHAWEILRVTYDLASISTTGDEVQRRTGYRTDARQAQWTLSTGYVFAPVYGKYGFSDSTLVHFDGYLGLSVGTRFADGQLQLMGEPVVGMTHYLTSRLALTLPEVRFKIYSEDRNRTASLVTEFLVQAGMSWLF